MLYGSHTWYLLQNGIWILKKAEKAMVRVMCGLKLFDWKQIKDLM